LTTFDAMSRIDSPAPPRVDQASRLRELAARQHRALVVALTSGKGGVGKTNLAVNLAIEIARRGRRVVLLDADLGLANADVLLNVNPQCNLAHVVARRKSLEEVIVDAPGGIRFVAGASGLARMADLPPADRLRLVSSLDQLEWNADCIVVDTGAGISPSVLGFVQSADRAVIVTTPEPTAVTDAYAMIKVLTRSEVPAGSVSLLVNQARSVVEAEQVRDRIARVARQFLGVGVFDAGHIPFDPVVAEAVRRRTPFVLASPGCPASRAVAELAGRLEPGLELPERSGFFDRLGRWLGKTS
jgi:flagellar biosynthesis protein FlhG